MGTFIAPADGAFMFVWTDAAWWVFLLSSGPFPSTAPFPFRLSPWTASPLQRRICIWDGSPKCINLKIIPRLYHIHTPKTTQISENLHLKTNYYWKIQQIGTFIHQLTIFHTRSRGKGVDGVDGKCVKSGAWGCSKSCQVENSVGENASILSTSLLSSCFVPYTRTIQCATSSN